MANQPRTAAQSLNAELELFELRNIIGLAAFAADARRILGEIHLLSESMPRLGAELRQLVTNGGYWTERPETLAGVLDDVHRRLGVILEAED